MRRMNLIASCLMIALVAALAGGAVIAQQATTDIWKLVPPDSLLVAAFDGRPDNPSMRVLDTARDPAMKETLAKQQAAMRKAVENLATLFGMTLDFAKDIESWSGQQQAFVLVPDDKNGVQPVLMVASKDEAAANAWLDKLLEPWQRVANITQQEEMGYRVTSIEARDSKFQLYVSASGPVVALSTSKAALQEALKGGGFAPGSPGDKAFAALTGSMFYAFADPVLLKQFHAKPEVVPLTGFGLGVSAIETGVKVRILGFPTEEGAAMLKQMLPAQQTGTLAANPGIPSASLAVAALPNLTGAVTMAGAAGLAKSPIFGVLKAVTDVQVSGAITAVLPTPAWVISAMADSDQAAAAKMDEIKTGLQQLKADIYGAGDHGITGVRVGGAKGTAVFLGQSGKHIFLAGDVQSVRNAVDTVDGKRPSIAQSATYNETIAGLEGCNLLTVYGNFAPIQGLGFLVDASGLGQAVPMYGAIAKSLESVHSVGIGAGFDGQIAGITIFLRANPGTGATIGPAAMAGTAVAAAVLFPVFARAHDAAGTAQCMNNLRQLTLAAQIYAADHKGKLPTSAKWRIQLGDYAGGITDTDCPIGESIYAFNKNLSGIKSSKISHPSDTVMFFEADLVLPDGSGSRNDAILPHNGYGCFAFADGHVQKLSEVPPQSQWVPYTVKKPVKKAPVKKAPARAKRH